MLYRSPSQRKQAPEGCPRTYLRTGIAGLSTRNEHKKRLGEKGINKNVYNKIRKPIGPDIHFGAQNPMTAALDVWKGTARIPVCAKRSNGE